MKKKVCVITGSRAEYGLLYHLMKEVKEDKDLSLQIIATGMHLSPEFGLTYKEIEKDGFKIDKKIEILLSSDSEIGVGKAFGLGMISFTEALAELEPEMIILLGDRFEALAAAISALIQKRVIAHIHGGEITAGAFDDSFRHSISKISHLHFTATEEYRKRVIQLGENPKFVFNFGGIGIDNIKRQALLSKQALEETLAFSFDKKNLLITYHPVTLEKNTTGQQFNNLLKALDELNDTKLIFTKPNADTGGRIIIKMIDEYVKNNTHKSVSFTSMGQLAYLSALQFVDAVVGNSSSGLIEAPSFHIATVNIGDRQKGRIMADSVVDCQPHKNSISSAIQRIYSKEFQLKLKKVRNPYGNGGASVKIKNTIKKFLGQEIIKKEFYDFKIN